MKWVWLTCVKTHVVKPRACEFRSGRIILQQEILPEQMAKLLNDGKTDLLPGFVSQRTRRPFKAFLVLGKDGKTGFEFEARKTPAKGKAAANDEAEGGSAPAARATRSTTPGCAPREEGCGPRHQSQWCEKGGSGQKGPRDGQL